MTDGKHVVLWAIKLRFHAGTVIWQQKHKNMLIETTAGWKRSIGDYKDHDWTERRGNWLPLSRVAGGCLAAKLIRQLPLTFTLIDILNADKKIELQRFID